MIACKRLEIIELLRFQWRKEYVLIDKQENVVFEGRIQTTDFDLPKLANYNYLKFEITGVIAGNTNTPPQLNEIELK